MRLACIVILLSSGCLSKTLRIPVEDHAVQSTVIAKDCEAAGFGNGKCTQEDIDAMAEQARLLDDIVKRHKPAEKESN